MENWGCGFETRAGVGVKGEIMQHEENQSIEGTADIVAASTIYSV
jgi:hypothetical protein